MSKIVLIAGTLVAASADGLASNPAMAADARTATVEIRDMKFNPATLTIIAGTTVTWVNEDAMPHTV